MRGFQPAQRAKQQPSQGAPLARGFQPGKRANIKGQGLAGFANGGPVRGPGTGTSDDVPDTVAEGTYIMPADSTAAMGEQALAGMGQKGVPVNLSNGEFKMPPEQVHAVGVQALDQIKNATHIPVGFAPGAQRGQEPEPRMFFANGGVVDDERRQPSPATGPAPQAAQVMPGVFRSGNSYGDSAALGAAPAAIPAPEQRMASNPNQTSPSNIFPQASPSTGAPIYQGAGFSADQFGSSGRLAQVPASIGQQPGRQPAPAAPAPAPAAAGLPGAAFMDQATPQRPALNAQPAADPQQGAAAVGFSPARQAQLPPVPVAGPAPAPQAQQVMPGVFRSGNSYGDSEQAAITGAAPRGMPTARNMAAADALATGTAGAGSTARGFGPAAGASSSADGALLAARQAAAARGDMGAVRDSYFAQGQSFGGQTRESMQADQLRQLALSPLGTPGRKAAQQMYAQQLQASTVREAQQVTRDGQQANTGIALQRLGQDATYQTGQNDIARQRLAIDAVRAGQAGLPAGYRSTADGRGLESIPGGPADLRNSKEVIQQGKDAQDVISVLNQARPLVNVSTGSYAGAAVDKVAQVFGVSTPGAEAAAQLKALQGALVSKMPKMSGPQSDKDVQLYREMAGQIGDSTIPARQRLAAMKTIEELQKRHAPANAAAQGPGAQGAAPDARIAELQRRAASNPALAQRLREMGY